MEKAVDMSRRRSRVDWLNRHLAMLSYTEFL
jgi:hypothetical protein